MNLALPVPAAETQFLAPSRSTAAVERCCEAYRRSRAESRALLRDDFDTEMAAWEAYREAMPFLIDREGVRDFIACTAHGMVIGAIDDVHGTKLLYAAQVALGVLGREPKDKKSE